MVKEFQDKLREKEEEKIKKAMVNYSNMSDEKLIIQLHKNRNRRRNSLPTNKLLEVIAIIITVLIGFTSLFFTTYLNVNDMHTDINNIQGYMIEKEIINYEYKLKEIENDESINNKGKLRAIKEIKENFDLKYQDACEKLKESLLEKADGYKLYTNTLMDMMILLAISIIVIGGIVTSNSHKIAKYDSNIDMIESEIKKRKLIL